MSIPAHSALGRLGWPLLGGVLLACTDAGSGASPGGMMSTGTLQVGSGGSGALVVGQAGGSSGAAAGMITMTPGAGGGVLATGGTAAVGGAGAVVVVMGGAPSGGGAAPMGAAGTGPGPDVVPVGVAVTTHDVGVDGVGTVFNVADDYFNDRLVPRTPVANFGTHSPIIAVPNADGSLDVAWLDYANGEGRPWAVESPAMIYVTHIDVDLATASTRATGVSSYKMLGFAKDAAAVMYVAYNADHALKTDAQGDENNINGNELHVAQLGENGTTWDTLLFGDQDNNADESLGDPAGAANSILGYDAVNDKLVLYQGHSMMWTPVRHQAGFIRVLEPADGTVLRPAGDDIIHFGAGWWYSHNFNQRMIIDDGAYYMLAHGDAYSRQLGFAKWTLQSYMDRNETEFNESYWDIAGNEGDNNTNAQTGQFVRLPDGRFLMAHTTSDGRSARDVRLVIADGDSGALDQSSEVWLTQNVADVHATMAKVAVLGDRVLVTYALWPGDHDLTWYAALLDTSLNVVTEPEEIPGIEHIDSAPLFQFPAGPNAGKVGWVSGNAAHTLTVGVAEPRYE